MVNLLEYSIVGIVDYYGDVSSKLIQLDEDTNHCNLFFSYKCGWRYDTHNGFRPSSLNDFPLTEEEKYKICQHLKREYGIKEEIDGNDND